MESALSAIHDSLESVLDSSPRGRRRKRSEEDMNEKSSVVIKSRPRSQPPPGWVYMTTYWRRKAVKWDNNAHTFCRTRMRIVSVEDENLNNYSLNVVSSSSSIVRPKPTVPEKPKYIGDIMKAYLKHKPTPKPNKENHRQLISRVSHPSKSILYNRFSFNSRLLLPL